MRIIWVLFAKEVKALFSSWIAYVVLIAFITVSGISFYLAMQMFIILTQYSSTVQEGVARQEWNVLENLVSPLYSLVFILLFVMVPAITMRLFAEEKKQRTEELLLTSPIRVGAIVLSKYLAAVLLITVMLLAFGIYPAIVIYYGRPSPDWGPILTGYLGLFCMAVSLAAIGVFASSLTENQIVAFVITVALEMLFFIVSQATVAIGVIRLGARLIDVGGFLRAFSIGDHFAPMLAGIVRASDLFYFLALIVFWLWASRQSVESARWG
jgi:ABC-2 type transport system permease protein